MVSRFIQSSASDSSSSKNLSYSITFYNVNLIAHNHHTNNNIFNSNKPLSARVLPFALPVGKRTDVPEDNPYLVNTDVFSLR